MSEEACAWAQGQLAGNRTAKFVLMRLAAYCDVEGVGWIHIPTIATQIEADERTVQRALRKLESLALINKTGDFKYRLIPYYKLDMDGSARAAVVAAAEAANGDKLSPLESGPMVTPEAANGDTGVTPKKITKPSEGSNDPPSGRARASEIGWVEALRDQAFSDYPAAGKLGVSGQREFAEAWASEVADGADPRALAAACRMMGRDRSLWGASGKPIAAHNFLARGRWKGVAETAAAQAPVAAATAWSGPAEIREQLAARKPELLASFDRCSWDGAAIVPWSTWTRDQLRAALKDTEIVVLDPVKAGVG